MSKLSPQKQAEQFLAQTTALENQIQHYSAEAQAAQKRAQSLRAELEAETTKLLAERQKAFEKQLTEFKEAIFAKQQELEAVVLGSTDIQSQIDAADTRLIYLKARIDERQTELNALTEPKKQLSDLKQQIIDANDDIGLLYNDRLAVQNDIQLLTTQKNELQTIITGLIKEETNCKISLETIKTATKVEIDDRDDKIANLNQLIYEKQSEYKMFDVEMEQVRTDLVSRQAALDGKDLVLRAREQKVSQDESKIQQNAAYLNL